MGCLDTLYEKIRTKFSANYAKQTQFPLFFAQKQGSHEKTNPNKPNFRNTKTKAFSRKGGFTMVFTILQKFTLDWCLLVYLSGAKLITLKGAFLTSK
jgi:hypothetical protein